MTTTEIANLSTEEKLALMEELWDSLTHEEKSQESPNWHRTVLEERRANIAAGDTTYLSLDEVRNKYK